MGFVDTHCHLNFHSFDADFLPVALRSKKAGIDKIIIVGSDFDTSKEAIVRSEIINEQIPNFAHAAVGIHPVHCDRRQIKEIKELAGSDLVVAVGEAGLDFYHDDLKKTEQAQLDLFKQTIELSIEINKPLIVHNRLADGEIKEVIERYPELKRAVFHCFSTDHHFAAWAMERGFYISFTGNITYGNKKLKKVIERTSIERIMIETDSPYIVPEPVRSQNKQKNEPKYVIEVASKIAEIKSMDIDQVAEITTKNALEFFGL
jgi:TatD DNase family protein